MTPPPHQPQQRSNSGAPTQTRSLEGPLRVGDILIGEIHTLLNAILAHLVQVVWKQAPKLRALQWNIQGL